MAFIIMKVVMWKESMLTKQMECCMTESCKVRQVINPSKSSTCLGVKLDCRLSWFETFLKSENLFKGKRLKQ